MLSEGVEQVQEQGSDLRQMIAVTFAENGIIIAFPQRDLHLNTARPLAVEIVPAPDRHPLAAQDVNPTPQLPAPQVSLITLADLPALRAQPLFEPMTSVTAEQPSTPVATPVASGSTGKSPGPAKIRTGKAGGKIGSGGGKRTKRTTPTSPPQLLSSPPPRYPAEARAAKKTGKVGVLVRVLANGAAASTSVYRSSGNPQLDQAAVKAARSWKFSQTPSLEAGATIAVVVQVTFAL